MTSPYTRPGQISGESPITERQDPAAGTVSDAAYGAGWNGVTTIAPSKNAVYDKIETLGTAGNSFATIDCPSGTDPIADSATDTLQLTAAGAMEITGDATADSVQFKADVHRAVAVQSITAAATAITATDGSPYRLVSSDAAYTLTAEPTIAAGRNGQLIELVNVGNFNITVQDTNALGGSLLRLTSATNKTIQPGGHMKFLYNSTLGFWFGADPVNPATFTPSVSSFTVDGSSSPTHEWGDGSTANDTAPVFAVGYVGSPSAAEVTLTVAPDAGYPLTLLTPFTSGTGAQYFRSATRNGTRTFRVTATVAGTAGLTRDVVVTYRAANYVGVNVEATALTAAMINALVNVVLDTDPYGSFAVTAGALDYIWCAFVDGDATPYFAIAGERAGFTLKQNAFSHTTTYLKVQAYDTYRSDLANLGSVTVVTQSDRPPTKRYIGKAATTGPLSEATIEALQLSDLTESPNGTFASITGLATGLSIWFCVSNANIAAPTHYGLSPGNGSSGYQEAAFTAAALVNVTNVYGYAEDYKEIYSNVSELQAVNINGGTNTTWSLKTQAAAFANRIYMGPGPATDPISNANILALDDVAANGVSNLQTTVAGNYAVTIAGGNYLWFCHPDAIADLTTIKDQATGFGIDGSYRTNVSHVNDFGVTEVYRCWRSTNPSIFPTGGTVVVT